MAIWTPVDATGAFSWGLDSTWTPGRHTRELACGVRSRARLYTVLIVDCREESARR